MLLIGRCRRHLTDTCMYKARGEGGWHWQIACSPFTGMRCTVLANCGDSTETRYEAASLGYMVTYWHVAMKQM